MEVDWYRAVGTALMVSIIGPLFWLGVNVLENRLRLGWTLLRERLRRRNREKTEAAGRLLK